MTMIERHMILRTAAIGLSLLLLFTQLVMAQDLLTSTLLSRIGWLRQEKTSIQFTNVQHCGKTVSVTAGHYVLYDMVIKVKPDAKLLLLDMDVDVAIFEVLGPALPATIARRMPGLLDEVYVATYAWTIQAPVVLRYSVAGYQRAFTIYQGMAFLGASGSGIYDKTGAYLGPIVNMATGPGFVQGPGDSPPPMQIGLTGGVRVDKLLDILDKLLCTAHENSIGR